MLKKLIRKYYRWNLERRMKKVRFYMAEFTEDCGRGS